MEQQPINSSNPQVPNANGRRPSYWMFYEKLTVGITITLLLVLSTGLYFIVRAQGGLANMDFGKIGIGKGSTAADSIAVSVDPASTVSASVEPTFQTDIEFRDQFFHTFLFDRRTQDLKVYYHDTEGKRYGQLNVLADRLQDDTRKLLFATNGGIFDPDFSPVGLTIIDGATVQPINEADGEGNFFLKPNGVFFQRTDGTLGILITEQYVKRSIAAQQATQSGPMLLIDGRIHPAFREGSTNKFIRSGVGLIDADRAVFAISQQPVNFYDFASFFKTQYDCQQALYLDGVISSILVPGQLEAEKPEKNYSTMIGINERTVQ